MGLWHIITGEYPPQIGGVSDYTSLIATGLAVKGNTIHVWAPEWGSSAARVPGVELHRLAGHFGPRALAKLSHAIQSTPECSLLVQYVPHAFGYKAMNLPFCMWLKRLQHHKLTLMFHEVAFPLRWAQTPRHNLLGAVTLLMARIVSRSASRIMVASAQWKIILRKLGATAPIAWVPVPSNVPVVDSPSTTAAWRQQCGTDDGLLLGNFAGYSNYSVEHLMQIMPSILATDRRRSLLLMGVNSQEFRRRLVNTHPQLEERVHSTGVLDPAALSSALAACDVMIQPYPDGVSTRRCSVTALLAHRRAIVTTDGAATEPLWRKSAAVALAQADNPVALREHVEQTIRSSEARRVLQGAARELYENRFALHHTISSLLAA